MPIFSYRDLIRRTPKRAGFIADTSFVLQTISSHEKEAQQLKEALLASGSVLFCNVNVRNELFHFMRYLIVDRRLENTPNLFHPDMIKLWKKTDEWNQAPHERLKTLTNAGYVDLFKVVFGERGEILQGECDKALAGFTYITKEDFPAPVKWENMAPLMAMYGLDSSDAMIVNLASSHKTFSGIISADYDYLHCADAFDIVVPKSRPAPQVKPCVPSKKD